MPYYDRDGRELSGQYDSSASGNWVYTDGGAPVESARGRDLRFAASERANSTLPRPRTKRISPSRLWASSCSHFLSSSSISLCGQWDAAGDRAVGRTSLAEALSTVEDFPFGLACSFPCSPRK